MTKTNWKAVLCGKSYQEATAIQDSLEAKFRSHAAVMSLFPRGSMNLTTEEAKETPEWKTARAESAKAFSELREFNSVFVKQFKTEIRSKHNPI